jgi:hypothetical protein
MTIIVSVVFYNNVFEKDYISLRIFYNIAYS